MIRRAISTAAFWLLTMANAPAAASESDAARFPTDVRSQAACAFASTDPDCRDRERDRRRHWVRVSYPTYAGYDYAFFAAPALNGVSVDSCLDGRLARCGAPAADAFCQRAGFYKARSFATTFGRGLTVRADTVREDPDARRGTLFNVMCVI